jgi:hypothetical protein
MFLFGGATLFLSPQAGAEKVLQGQVCLQRVQQLTSDISWYKSLGKAQEEARETGKLIVWIHMVGKIDGAT